MERLRCTAHNRSTHLRNPMTIDTFPTSPEEPLAVADKAHQALDEASGRAQAKLDDAKPMIQQATAAGHSAIDQAADASVATAVWLGDKEDAVIEFARDTLATTRQFITDHPMRCVAIALAAGYFSGRVAAGLKR